MNIKVEINKKEPNKNIIESEEIICPECKESILVKIEDCKIRMYKCRNNHKIDKLLTLEEFRNTQRINKFTIKCNICNDIYKNEMYKCRTCNKNICQLCKENHDENHIIIYFEKRNIICEHNDFYIKYCRDCEKNICINCEEEHNNHNIFNYENILHEIYDEKEFNNYIEKLKNEINNIIMKLNKIMKNIELYKNINDNIIKNKNRNYQILSNRNEFMKFSNKIIENIKYIINEENIINKFENIMNIYYNNITENYIISELYIKEEDINKDIKIINSYEQYKNEKKFFEGYGGDEYKYENEKEIKEKCKIKINDEIIPFNYFHKFEKVGKFEIKYIFSEDIKNIDYLFCNCTSFINIDLSNFNAQNIINMCSMFSD